MQKLKCNYVLCFLLVIALALVSFPYTRAYAETASYTDVLDDLRKDESFSPALYPEDADDYSLQVIQIAESQDKELFVYVYQPCQIVYPLVATDINMSLSDKVGSIVVDDEEVLGSDISRLYGLTLINSRGVFAKYKVNGLTVGSGMVRYYTISSIYRDYIEGVDGGSGNDNTKLSKAFAVGKQFAAMTTESGVSYACKDIDFVVIKNPFVDFLAYGTYDGFDLIFGNVDYTDIHYIAFTPDRQIDTLKEADVTYTTQPYTINGEGKDTGFSYGEKSDPQFITLTGDEEFGVDGYPEYTWKSIYTAQDFMATTTLTCEAKTQVENNQFVLVFLATKCSVQELSDLFQGHYQKVTGTKVSDVAILRLMFETDGVTYNLGVVMDKQEGDEIAGNRPENNGGCGGISWQTILAIIALVVLLIIFAPFLPYIVRFVVWIISLPFKAIAAIVRRCREKHNKYKEVEDDKHKNSE